MTLKERNTVYGLCAFACLSVCTGLLHFLEGVLSEDVLDFFYYLGENICEVTLLYIIYYNSTQPVIKTLLAGLITLSFGELFDECLGNNIGFRLNDYILLIVTAVVVYKTIKNGRNKRRNISGGY